MAETPQSKQQEQRRKEDAIDRAFQSEPTTIIPIDLEEEMKKSFIDYAMSVISDRALPDVRDGLKPVHRRILYSMFSQGFTSDKPYRKCATTVGDVLGRFHPHGDAAVYDTLVRLAQDFSMRHMLVDGHGNFGSRDGDPPAAYRYTEARLTKLAGEMMNNINKDTVDFVPNFDEHHMEPVVLPTGYPNLLVNGSTGIAVGMATNIPPHNLGEVIDGALHLLEQPDATVDELMQFIPGPDFPTGASILGMSGIRQAYKTGRGRILVRAHINVEEMRGNRHRLIVTDLPYLVNKARLIERIADLVQKKTIEGISDIRDESDRHDSVRIVIELKRDATPLVVMHQLFRHTQLQDTFSANMLALVPDAEGKYEPHIIGLKDALVHYLNHEAEVIRRRTRFELGRAEARRHIVEGLQLAIDHIDEVINIIRSSKNEDEAKQNLIARFGFSEKQAQHVVDMRLGRLSGLEREKLLQEHAELCERIDYYNRILDDETLLHSVIKEEMLEIKRKYADPRRTVIDQSSVDDIEDESLIEEEQVVIAMTHAGYIKRVPTDVYSAQHRGGKGVTGVKMREDDFVEQILTTSTHNILLFFTNMGRVYRLRGFQIPEASRTARGMAVVNLLQLQPGEKVYGMIPITSFDEGGSLLMATKNGLVKKSLLSDYTNIQRNGLIAINLREGDELVGVKLTGEQSEAILVTRRGMSIRFKTELVRETGRNTMGVRGIDLRQDDVVIGMVVAEGEGSMLVITENGFGKRSDLDDYRLQNRGGKGLITYRVSHKTGLLVGCALVSDDKDVLLINDIGTMIRIRAADIPTLSRNTQGVTLMRSREGIVADMAVVEHDDDEDEEAVMTVEAKTETTASPTEGSVTEMATDNEISEGESDD